MNKILLLRLPREIVPRLRVQKLLPLPIVEGIVTPRNIGLCDFKGCNLLLKTKIIEIVPTLDALPRFQNLTEGEFYRLVSDSKQTAIASVEKISHDCSFHPSQFKQFPRFDGEYLVTETDSIPCQNWLNSEPSQRQVPQPKPSLDGLLSGAFDC